MAEILITLGVIGVIAAMTLPSLYGRIQEKIFTNKLIKTYNELLQATKLIADDYGGINGLGSMTAFKTVLPQYIKLSPGTEPRNYNAYYIDGNTAGDYRSYGLYYLENGAILRVGSGGNIPDLWSGYICTQTMAMDATTDRGLGYGTYGMRCGDVVVDVNGSWGPNVWGKDIFGFALVTDGLLPKGGPKEAIWCQQFDAIKGRNSIYYNENYAAWVIYNKNMDYLHCTDLSWEGKHKCGN